MANDDLDDKETEEQSAIRGAFLRHHAQTDALGEGAAGGTEPDTVRGAYLSRVSRATIRKRGDIVVGSEETGGAVLRGIYASRTTVVVVRPAAARPAPAKKKAAPAKKAAPKRKAKAAAPKRKAAPARPKAAKKAAPKRAANKKARRR